MVGWGGHDLRALGASESFVFAFDRPPHALVLRLGHSLRRTEAQVRGEIDWIDHLAAGGVPVATAIRSTGGRLVEAIDDGAGGRFLATAFVRAQGALLHDRWTPTLTYGFGRLLGRMHALAENYRPPRSDRRRPAWDDAGMDVVARYLPASEGAVLAKYRELCAQLRTLPTDRTCYGLIHFDAHGGNAVVDDAGRITLFDFDDCTYSWYVNDIAIALGHLVTNAPDAPALTEAFLPHLLRGYRTAYDLDPAWLHWVPVFLKMSEIFLYAVIHRDVDAITDPWCARFMYGRKERIERDVPTVDVDFVSLAKRL